MSDIISRRHLLETIKCVCTVGGIFEKPQVEYLKAFSELVKHEPSILEKEGVQIIWEHQIDDLLKEIETDDTLKMYQTDKYTSEIMIPLWRIRQILEATKEQKQTGGSDANGQEAVSG